MEVIFNKNFSKKFIKLNKDLKNKFGLRLDFFLTNYKDPILNIHNLHGKYDGFYSFNVNADYRVIFKYKTPDIVEFIAIGKHSELYE